MWTLALAGAMGLCLAGALHAGEAVLPPAIQAQVLVKVASFDRALVASKRPEIVIGILYQGNLRESLAVQEEFSRTVRIITEGRIGQRPFRALPIDWTGGADVADLIVRQKIDILYVTPLRSVSIAEIASAARSRGIRTWSSDPAYLDKGLSLGVGIRGDRPVILVNRAAALAEGADLSSELLKMARLVS